MKSIFLRVYRLALLLILGWLLHAHQSRLNHLPPVFPDLEVVQSHFPRATVFGSPDPQGWVPIQTKRNVVLGFARSTRPLSDNYIGYAGPSECLVILNYKRELKAVQLIQSRDTPEYVDKVKNHPSFWDSFTSHSEKPLLVTGATLTSASIHQGVQATLGSEQSSLKFPEPLTLSEVKAVISEAAKLQDSKLQPSWKDVLNDKDELIAHASVSSPEAENVMGYQGPTDLLVVVEPQTFQILALKVRSSFDTDDYVGYVTDDAFYLRSFRKYDLEQLKTLDFKDERIEGVTGATETSWAIAEGLKRKAQSWAPPSAMPFYQKWKETLRWQDAGLILMMLSSLLMMTTSLRGKKLYRRMHQLLLVGFVGLYSGALLSHALMVGWAKHGIPWEQSPALVLLFGISILSPVLGRRQFYCHHFCPHGTVQQWLQKLSPWHLKISSKWLKILSFFPSLLVVVGLALALLRPKLSLALLEPFDAWTLSVFSVVMVAFAGATLLISVFVPMAYCRFGCPTGALFKFLRFAGTSDRWGWKDAIALIIVLMVFLYERF